MWTCAGQMRRWGPSFTGFVQCKALYGPATIRTRTKDESHSTPVRVIHSGVTGGRWCNTSCARGKSEHQKAACLAKAREFGAQAPNDGQYHRKYTAPHHFGAGPATRMRAVWLDPKRCGVRLKRRGKSPPSLRVSGVAGETPCGARQNRGAGRLPDFSAEAGNETLGISRTPHYFGGGEAPKASPKWCGAFGKPSEINDRHSRKREQNSAYVTK